MSASILPSSISNLAPQGPPRVYNAPPVFDANQTIEQKIDVLLLFLTLLKIPFVETNGNGLPPDAQMHDRAAPVPRIVVSPRNEPQVIHTLKLLKHLRLYTPEFSISVKSGGHGYSNDASCEGLMINLTSMNNRQVVGERLLLAPGCLLGQVIYTLMQNRKALPHGDCFGVGAGGHFLTAGWDLILGRKYGLGCQSVMGGRVVLWDGSVEEIDEHRNPDLLHAMRGGAAAKVGIVTELRMQLIDEPERATWRFTRLTREQLILCVSHRAFSNAISLPREISTSFRFHFESDQREPVCSFNIVSLLPIEATLIHLREGLGEEITALVGDVSEWNEKSLLDLRMLPASDDLASTPVLLDTISTAMLHDNPTAYWKDNIAQREMASSYFRSISYWVKDCDAMFTALYDTFSSARFTAARERMYALVIAGGGRMSELQPKCSMPLGQALGRFEVHWDMPEEEQEQWCQDFTRKVSEIFLAVEDRAPGRPYRGDMWLKGQDEDEHMNLIHKKYDRR